MFIPAMNANQILKERGSVENRAPMSWITETGKSEDFKRCFLANVDHKQCCRGHVLVRDTVENRHVLDIIDLDCAECFILWGLGPLEAKRILDKFNHGSRDWPVINYV